MFKELFSQIPTEYIPQISDYIKVLLPCLATYIVTRYSLNSPKRMEIMQKQFDLVYLPLYQLTQQVKPIKKASRVQLINYSKRIIKILHKNYEFAFPHLHNLANDLLNKLNAETDYENTLADIVYQIEFDYERLRHQLGYPSQNIFQFLKRLKRKDKLHLVLLFFLFAVTFYLLNGLTLAIVEHNFSMLFCSIVVFALIYFVLHQIQ